MQSDGKDRKGRFPIHYSTGCIWDTFVNWIEFVVFVLVLFLGAFDTRA